MQPELELGHDAKVAAAAADRPEQVRVPLVVDLQDSPVRDHDLSGDQVVDRKAAEAREPAHSSAEGEPADAGVTDHSRRSGQAVRLGRGVEVREQRTARDACASSLGVHADPVHPA